MPSNPTAIALGLTMQSPPSKSNLKPQGIQELSSSRQ